MLVETPAALGCLTICTRCKDLTHMCTAGLPRHAQQDRHSMHSRAATACIAGEPKHACGTGHDKDDIYRLTSRAQVLLDLVICANMY